MFILGLPGSPRRKGNTSVLLSSFLSEAEAFGARTRYLEVARMNISPCRECRTCEREGFCPIDDDMQEVYSLLRQADLVVSATPIFFYGFTAQMKALIDRSQALWARRYVHKLEDPGRKWRTGLLLALGATKGKNLFEGVDLTAKYFFDAVGASFEGTLGYRQIENPEDIKGHPAALRDVAQKAAALVRPFEERKKVLFVCRENAARSQMASAFARYHAGDKLDVESAGSAPAEAVNPMMIEVMEERGFDMAFRKPKSLDETLGYFSPELIVTMGCEEECPYIPGARSEEWDLSDPEGKPFSFMREIRDNIKERVKQLAGI